MRDETFMFSLAEMSREIKWLDRKIYLTSQKDNAKSRIVKRNEIYWCDYGVGVGSEMDKCRPRACLKNHSRDLHSPLCGEFIPNLINIARYAS